MLRAVIWLAILCSSAPALGQDSQVKKAQAGLEAYESGDRSALDKALVAIEKAAGHKKTADKGSVWVLKGRILTSIALDGGVPDSEAVKVAVEAWEGAVERGAGADAIAADLVRILSATTLVIRDDLESKRIQQAWVLVDAAMKAHALLTQVDWSDPRVEAPLLRLATIVAAKAAQLDPAVEWFGLLTAASELDPSAAVQVAHALNGGRDLESAISFLDPLIDERPLDAALLSKAIEILVAGDQLERAQAMLDEASAHKGAKNTGSSLLLARLYREVGNEAAATEAYQRALEYNPEATEAWVPLAELLIQKSAKLQTASESQRGSQKRATLKERMQALETAAELLERAYNANAGKASRQLLEAMVQVYTELGSDKLEATQQALQSLDEAE